MPGSSSQGIFLSYRREDAGPYARLLQVQLSQRISDAPIFMDLDSIEPGLDFAEVIEDAVHSCAVLLALIGRQWTELTDEEGVRRLDDPDDYVRFEVKTALERGVRVIPVLIDGAKPLRQRDLPAELHKLARLNAHKLSYDRYQHDADRLLDLIERLLANIGGQAQADRKAPAEADRKAPAEADRKAAGQGDDRSMRARPNFSGDQLVQDYLTRVAAAAHRLPKGGGIAFVGRMKAQVEQQLRAVGTDDPGQVREILAALGSPEELVAEELLRIDSKRRLYSGRRVPVKLHIGMVTDQGITDCKLTRWLKREGEHVEIDEPLFEIATDRGTSWDLPSPASGVLRRILVPEDGTFVGTAELAEIDEI